MFYTPPEVAARVAEAAARLWRARWPAKRAVRVLDPSCGAGALLEAAARAFTARAPGVRVTLLGTDRDPGALALAARVVPGASLTVADALAEGTRADVVVTNPPYGPAPPPDIDRYVTFWRAAARRVRPGGVLAALVPTSWRTGRRYGQAREAIAAMGLREVVELPQRPFADAYVDTCVALCLPGEPAIPVPSSPDPFPPRNRAQTLADLFHITRGVRTAPGGGRGTTRLLVGPVLPFVWPDGDGAFVRLDPARVLEGKGSLAVAGARRLLVRRIVGRTWRLTTVVPEGAAAVKKDFYVLVPRDRDLSLDAYAALLHARPTARALAASENAAVKGDFAQISIAALGALPVPALTRGRAETVWLERWARRAGEVARAIARSGVRTVDADPRWGPLRSGLDDFVGRLGTSEGTTSFLRIASADPGGA